AAKGHRCYLGFKMLSSVTVYCCCQWRSAVVPHMALDLVWSSVATQILGSNSAAA
ncbi:hypothetical protein U1Q18_006843, partial [Sarracenia purpurea var. burkii]